MPSLLGLARGYKPTDLEAPAYAGTEAVAGHECWKITGKGRIGATTLWIDTTSHLVRRIVEKDRLTPPKGGPVDVEATTTYDPTIDGTVDVALLAPPDGKPLPQRPEELPAWVGITFDSHVNTGRVQTVVTGGPAERAGIKVGDVVTSVDGEQVGDATKIISRLRAHKSGSKVHLVLARDGKDIPMDVTMEPRPDFAAIQKTLVGSPAPDFSGLPVLSGPPIDRSKGRVTIVDFWATWCGPCTYAMPQLSALQHKYKELRIIGISSEDEKDIKQFIAENKIDYTIARDAGDTVAGRYFVTGLPTLAIIDKAGVVRYLHVGAGDFKEIEAQVQQYLK
jgi:thiol-disulfide isomerase/thioredoxin